MCYPYVRYNKGIAYMSNMKHCPYCHCNTVVKYGVQNGRQRYHCKKCTKNWQTKSQPQRLYKAVCYDYFVEDLKLDQLHKRYNFSKEKLRKIIEDYTAPPIIPHGKHNIVAMDCTYFGKLGKDEWGILIVIDAITGECLYCEELPGYETYAHYCKALDVLAGFGVHPKACVIDGVTGLAGVLEGRGMLVQYCQFHQIKTVIGYLTRNPVLEPNKQLKHIALELTRRKRSEFVTIFNTWYHQNQTWLREKSRNPETHKLEYTHQKTRSAVHSLQRNFKYLYTFEQYPKLNIPNTNNMLEGINSAIKHKLNHHRGAKKRLKTQLIRVFLSRKTGV